MISKDIFENCVMRAALAPTVHNTQPARWVCDRDVLSLFCNTNVGLTVGDPTERDAALSCGAVLEAMVLALSAHGIAACATLTDKDTSPGQGLVVVAHLTLSRGPKDGLHAQHERRFTWRGLFASQPAQLYGWTRADTRLVVDLTSRDWIAERNDWASYEIMQSAGFRRELVSWMRLNDRHPRARLDGMDRASMRLSRDEARAVPFVLIKLWQFLNVFGFTKNLTAEYEVTLTAPVIALFHCDITGKFGRIWPRLSSHVPRSGVTGVRGLADGGTIGPPDHHQTGL